jgi:hypothetical protein
MGVDSSAPLTGITVGWISCVNWLGTESGLIEIPLPSSLTAADLGVLGTLDSFKFEAGVS